MKKSDSLLNKALFLLPRLILWGVCMLYFGIVVIIYFEVFKPYLYPLESYRNTGIGRK